MRRAPLVVPDPLNPRFSYGGGKIICELMAINYGRKELERVLIFRPHNVYGPDMGFEHVIPQFCRAAAGRGPSAIRTGRIPFEIQGDGTQTRSFCYVDDLVDGVMVMRERGRASRHLSHRHDRGDHHRGARAAHREPCRPGDGGSFMALLRPAARSAAAPRYRETGASSAMFPRVPLAKGLPPTVDWYFSQSRAGVVTRQSIPSGRESDISDFGLRPHP